MSTPHFTFRGLEPRRSEPDTVRVVAEGLAALVALVAVIGAACGVLTWGLVRLATLLLS